MAHPIEIKRPTIPTLVHRGLCKRCPRCGDGKIFEKWHEVVPHCEACNLELQARGETAGLFIPGLCLIGITLPYRKSLVLALDFLVDPDSAHTPDGENN